MITLTVKKYFPCFILFVFLLPASPVNAQSSPEKSMNSMGESSNHSDEKGESKESWSLDKVDYPIIFTCFISILIMEIMLSIILLKTYAEIIEQGDIKYAQTSRRFKPRARSKLRIEVNKIRNALAEEDIGEILAKLYRLTSDRVLRKKYQDEVLLLLGRWNELKSQRRLGLLGQGEFGIHSQKVRKSILDITNNLLKLDDYCVLAV